MQPADASWIVAAAIAGLVGGLVLLARGLAGYRTGVPLVIAAGAPDAALADATGDRAARDG